jgi:hypothetical protein
MDMVSALPGQWWREEVWWRCVRERKRIKKMRMGMCRNIFLIIKAMTKTGLAVAE